jgi:hypothetical protein
MHEASRGGAYALARACGRRSPPRGSSGHPLSPVRKPAGEETRCRQTDRPRPVFGRRSAKRRRHPTSRGALPRRNRRAFERIAPPDVRVGLSLTPPTRSPQVGERCSVENGHCKRRGAVTRDPRHPRDRCLWYPLDCPCLGLTTQARQLARSARSVAESDCSARATPAAAPRRLLRPRARGPMCRGR